jgi:hypothetical protein
MADDLHLGKQRDHLNALLAGALLDALAPKARCYSAMAQMWGTRRRWTSKRSKARCLFPGSGIPSWEIF